MRVIIWKKSLEPKVTTVTLVAQKDSELRYLNHLIEEGKAKASGDSYEVIVNLKEGKSVEDYKIFLSSKLHFPVEQD